MAKDCIPVSRKKLREVLEKKGTTITEASSTIGYGRSMLGSQISKFGGLQEPMIQLIELKYGISREQFVCANDPTSNSQIECNGDSNVMLERIIKSQAETNYKLEKLIKASENISGHVGECIDGQTAVLHILKNLEETIFNAVDKAWRQ